MKRTAAQLLGLVVVAGVVSTAFGMGHEIVNREDFSLNIGGRIQEVAYGQVLQEHVQNKDDARVYLFLKQARLNMNGQVNGIKYNTEWVGAAEDINGSNNGLTLLDFSFDVPLFNWQSTWFKVGQFKIPYGREPINDEAQFQLVEHSIAFLGTNLGRDVGAAIHSYHGDFAGTLGVFTGGSRDVPLRFLPEHLGVPMVVARVGLNHGLDKDIFTIAQNDLHPQHAAFASYVNGMYMKDTRIGHSTVLLSRTSEKSLLMNSNWNPFINQGAPVSPATTPNNIDGGEFWQAGWDAAARGPIGGNSGWNTEAEFDYSAWSNKYGSLKLPSAHAQAGFFVKKFEAALRWSALYPDNNFMKSGVRITGTRPIQEVAPAFSYYINGHDHKVVLDFPILIDVPVFVENGIGSYVSVEQPDQSTVISPASKGFVERQTVPEARLMYQLAF